MKRLLLIAGAWAVARRPLDWDAIAKAGDVRLADAQREPRR